MSRRRQAEHRRRATRHERRKNSDNKKNSYIQNGSPRGQIRSDTSNRRRLSIGARLHCIPVVGKAVLLLETLLVVLLLDLAQVGRTKRRRSVSSSGRKITAARQLGGIPIVKNVPHPGEDALFTCCS